MFLIDTRFMGTRSVIQAMIDLCLNARRSIHSNFLTSMETNAEPSARQAAINGLKNERKHRGLVASQNEADDG